MDTSRFKARLDQIELEQRRILARQGETQAVRTHAKAMIDCVEAMRQELTKVENGQ